MIMIAWFFGNRRTMLLFHFWACAPMIKFLAEVNALLQIIKTGFLERKE